MDSQRFDRVAEVFERARELAGELRAAFLDSARQAERCTGQMSAALESFEVI